MDRMRRRRALNRRRHSVLLQREKTMSDSSEDYKKQPTMLNTGGTTLRYLGSHKMVVMR